MSKNRRGRAGVKVHPKANNAQINLRIPPDDLNLFKTRAAAEGLSLSSYMRQCAAGTATVAPEIRSQILAAGNATFRAIVPDIDLTLEGMDALTWESLAPTELTWGETGTATEPPPNEPTNEPTEKNTE